MNGSGTSRALRVDDDRGRRERLDDLPRELERAPRGEQPFDVVHVCVARCDLRGEVCFRAERDEALRAPRDLRAPREPDQDRLRPRLGRLRHEATLILQRFARASFAPRPTKAPANVRRIQTSTLGREITWRRTQTANSP